ncbi:hypothetical protein HYX08_02080 [Candidatus Woesearchaeota archaeon]|nr:hypothetical protein [Candidatus Woesearchaeota archaeon]
MADGGNYSSYLLGRLSPTKRVRERDFSDLQRALSQFLNTQGRKGVTVTVEGQRVAVYVGDITNPVVDTVRSFVRGHEGWKFDTLASSRDGDHDLSAEMETLRAQNRGYGERIPVLEDSARRYQALAEERRETIRELEGRLRDSETGIQRRGLATQTVNSKGDLDARGLLAELTGDRDNYTAGIDGKITNYLSGIARQIAKREWYASEEFTQAQIVVNEKKEYIKKYGQDAVDNLPEIAREPMVSRWESAQAIVDAADKKTPPLEVIIHIKRTKSVGTVTIPYDGTANNEVGRAFGEAWKQFGMAAEAQLKYKIECSQDGLWSLTASSDKIDYKALERLLFESFRDVAERARLTIEPFYNLSFMEYRVRGVKIGELNPNPTQESGTQSDLRTYAKSRAIELGYRNLSALCDAKGISLGIISQRLGKTRLRKKSLTETALFLEVSEDEITRRLPQKK